MNDRIQLLAEQAEGTRKHVPAVWQFYDHELEKFARLIIQECVAKIEEAANTSPELYGVALEILEHFDMEIE